MYLWLPFSLLLLGENLVQYNPSYPPPGEGGRQCVSDSRIFHLAECYSYK